MPDFLVIIFWLWFAAGALILTYRLVTTGSFRAGEKPNREDTSEAERQATAERHAAFEAQLAAFAPTETATAMANADTSSPSGGAPVAASLPASPSNPDGLLPAAARVRSLAEALEGIHMPCDLVPLTDERVDERHLRFMTETTATEAVGTAIADELERLGFELVPMDERSIAALKPTARIEVRLLPDALPGVPSLVSERVPDGAVVVDFQLS